MLATLQRMGVVASFSRPYVSDDNPYSESLFKTLKYRPSYPIKPFSSIEAARAWVAGCVAWYNTEHLHSAISFATPEDSRWSSSRSIPGDRAAEVPPSLPRAVATRRLLGRGCWSRGEAVRGLP